MSGVAALMAGPWQRQLNELSGVNQLLAFALPVRGTRAQI
jgi:hypothetical protein